MTLNCNGKLIDLNTPKVMGVLNVTPDSFYDGGKFKNDKSFLSQAEKLIGEGADFIDIGGYSSRPKAEDITKEEEWIRVKPAIQSIKKEFPLADKVSGKSIRTPILELMKIDFPDFDSEKFLSIKNPKSAVPKAVENTISAVVRAFIEPIYFTP